MSDFYSEFTTTSSSEWMEKVVKDLKGKKTEDVLDYEHPIENIEYKAYAFSKKENDDKGAPNTPPYLRGTTISDNNWVNNVAIPNETPKKVNELALHHLMNGATGVRIDLSNFSVEDCEVAIREIGFEYISVNFIYHTEEQMEWLKNRFENKGYSISLMGSLETSALILEGAKSITVDGTEVQAAGGNVSQEIAWCLHRGHEKLFELLNDGFDVKDAVNQIKFNIGIGGNYFFEIAKIRCLRELWYTIVHQYAKNDKDFGRAHIEAQTGFVNKSLNDPHTNLLRQTTEALSAVVGGVDVLTVLPYNWYAKSPDLSKTQRLATNIGLLLKEESYMDKVIDPSGGSYSIEELSSAISDKAWEYFQLLEEGERNSFSAKVNYTAKKRVELINSKEVIHIGVNEYFNNDNPVDSWGDLPKTAFGERLVLEQVVKIEA